MAVYTGLRRGEVVALRWSDIDFEEKVLRVRKMFSRRSGEGLVYKNVEKGYSRRSVAITDEDVKELKIMRKHQIEENLKLGRQKDKRGLVFTLAGEPVCPDNISKQFKKAVRKNGYPDLRFHDLRHTHATILMSEGVSPKVVQERLGHHDIELTLKTYSHVMPTMQDEAAEIFSQTVNKNKNKNSLKQTKK